MTAGTSFAPIGERPIIDSAIAMVLAVNWPPHAPAPGQAALLDLLQALVVERAGAVRADRLEHFLDRNVLCRRWRPGMMVPP